ncbi:efflux RND transporter permease subunit [candidate division KSB1 bacterium]|nr:efflux RND transporter permease subunit [candidate division KSB1 bacterium]NIR69440.1 efflux RND transporter permease subunit [candidate division KSB1 bacterium]NIS22789.1 efflux RND transporter permease subunit [candidate division KSB1 bacterium]NIT69629.1 efflux RND transporter permease subunit [candidate division KSB1 bacterium]NIU23298.1 efflux RND transporter permease subunit [candidate division KSB1 bacterium]
MVRSKSSFLPRLALNRPVTVIMTLIALLVVGYIAFTQISLDLMPAGFAPPFLGVAVPYPNSNPQEVEEQIAKPVEQQIQTISGVRRIRSSSSSNGCWTFIEFAQGTDMDFAYDQLRDRMDRVKAELPEDVERVYPRKFGNDDTPIIWVALVENEPHDDPYLLVEQQLKKPLERIDGVATVEIWGAVEKSVLLQINQDLVKSYKINLYEVIQRLRRDNFSISSGFIKEGNRKIYVRSFGKFQSLEEIRNLPIRGTNLRLRDIAEVKYDVPERRWRVNIDGKRAITLEVMKESVANTVELSREVGKLFEQDFKNDPKLSGFRMEVLFNQGQFIEDSIENLQRTAMWGGLFAFFILYFFLRRFRMTIIVVLAIPLSTLITLIVLYFMDWSLNIITMMGLMISIGMVVDNSIVVLENIYRKRAANKSDRQASLEGTSEVALAVTLATLTTVVVFLPLILMNDNVGFRFFMLRIGLPVIVSLIASLFVAMVFIPLAATRIVSRRKVSEPKAIKKSNSIYQKGLAWAITHRMAMFVILVFAMMSMQWAASNTKRSNDQHGNINDFRFIFDMPENFTIEDAEQVFKTVEDTVRTKSDVYGVKTILARHSHNWGTLRVFLEPPAKKDWYEIAYENIAKSVGLMKEGFMSREEVIEDAKKRLPDFPGVDVRTSWHEQSVGDEASLAITLYGDDTGTLAMLAKEVERRLRSIPEIISIETDREKGADEIHLEINREQAKMYGISPTTISGTVQYALRGFPLPKYQTEEKEIDVRIQLREEDRRNLSQLKNLTFFTSSGKEIPLDAVANFKVKKGLGEIQREDGKTFLMVKANTTKDNMGQVYRKVDQVMKGFEMPYGYSWNKGQNFRRMQESDENFNFAVILSITFVFLLMGFLFESFVLPLSVILSIPFSFLGAFWIMYLTGTPIDMMSLIGFVILVGIVVNNAIVLIDLINRLRNEGYTRFDAILEAGKQRYRPILMTAFTTIGGLIPMAIGNASMIGIPYAPMGRTIIGGLLTSTLLSLIAVPWAYTLFDDMREYFKKLTALYIYKPKAHAPELAQAE